MAIIRCQFIFNINNSNNNNNNNYYYYYYYYNEHYHITVTQFSFNSLFSGNHRVRLDHQNVWKKIIFGDRTYYRLDVSFVAQPTMSKH